MLIVCNAHFVNNVQEMSRGRIIILYNASFHRTYLVERAPVTVGIQAPQAKKGVRIRTDQLFYGDPTGTTGS